MDRVAQVSPRRLFQLEFVVPALAGMHQRRFRLAYRHQVWLRLKAVLRTFKIGFEGACEVVPVFFWACKNPPRSLRSRPSQREGDEAGVSSAGAKAGQRDLKNTLKNTKHNVIELVF